MEGSPAALPERRLSSGSSGGKAVFMGRPRVPSLQMEGSPMKAAAAAAKDVSQAASSVSHAASHAGQAASLAASQTAQAASQAASHAAKDMQEAAHDMAQNQLDIMLDSIPAAEREAKWSAKFFVLVACLGALVVLTGVILKSVEGPHEKRKINDAKDRREFIEKFYLQRMFGLYIIPAQTHAHTFPPEMSCVVPTSTPRSQWCDTCVEELNSRGSGRYALQANSYLYSRFMDDRGNLTAWEGCEETEDCMVSCLLQLPTVDQVHECIGESTLINPVPFNESCLRENENCPNCWRLTPKLRDLSWNHALDDAADPSGDRFASAAQLYTALKEIAEIPLPERHWDLPGAVFFTATVYSTIGYGNFVARTRGGKICVIIFIVPAIILFGLAVSGLARHFLSSIQHMIDQSRADMRLKRAIRQGPGSSVLSAPERCAASKKWHKIVTSIDLDRNGSLSLEELLSAAKRNPQHTSVPRSEVRKIFKIFDADKSGYLDYHEAILMLMVLDDRHQAELAQEESEADIFISLTLTLVYIGVSAAIYKEIEQEWDYVTALYFVLVTLTTVGLGDVVPRLDTIGRRVFFYVFVCTGLGLVGSVLGSGQSLLDSKQDIKDISGVGVKGNMFETDVLTNDNRKDNFDAEGFAEKQKALNKEAGEGRRKLIHIGGGQQRRIPTEQLVSEEKRGEVYKVKVRHSSSSGRILPAPGDESDDERDFFSRNTSATSVGQAAAERVHPNTRFRDTISSSADSVHGGLMHGPGSSSNSFPSSSMASGNTRFRDTISSADSVHGGLLHGPGSSSNSFPSSSMSSGNPSTRVVDLDTTDELQDVDDDDDEDHRRVRR